MPKVGEELKTATETTLGGIKAASKTDNETVEVKIDPNTGKLYAPTGDDGTSDYNDLDNKPKINNVVLDGSKSAEDFGLVEKKELEAKQDKIDNVNISITGETGIPSGAASFSDGSLNIILQNIKGGKGDIGPANNLSIGSVVTSDYSVGARAEIIGESPNQVLNLSIPRGLKGDSGVQLGDIALVQETGSNENAVMSQKVITDNFKYKISGNTSNMLAPCAKCNGLVGNGGVISLDENYESYGPFNVVPGRKYAIYDKDLKLFSIALNARVIDESNDSYTSFSMKEEISIPDDYVLPVIYLTNFCNGSSQGTPMDFSNYMFVDITDGYPKFFIPYYIGMDYGYIASLTNNIGFLIPYQNDNAKISIDTINRKVSAQGRFFIYTPYILKNNTIGLLDVTLNSELNFDVQYISSTAVLCYNTENKAINIYSGTNYSNALTEGKELIVLGFGTLDNSGNNFFSLCGNIEIDGYSYSHNPKELIDYVKELLPLKDEAIKKENVRTSNLFNYADETYYGKIINSSGVWSNNASFNTIPVQLEAGKTYIRYSEAGVPSGWNTNVRVFNEDGSFVQQYGSTVSEIVVPEEAVNPIGYFPYYVNGNYGNPELMMVLPKEVSGDEQLPYYKTTINDEVLTDYIQKQIENVDISKSIVQTSGSSTDKVMSQNAVTNFVNNKVQEINSAQLVQSTGNSTEKAMSQKAVTDALAELSEQITGESDFRFAARPSSGYENFFVDVNCSIADNVTQSSAVQDTIDIKQDRCILALPTNYSRSGEGTRLVICGHVTGWLCKETTTKPNAGFDVQILLDEGYAVLGCNGTPGELDGLADGHNGVPECYRSILAAYRYVIEKYNIKRDGVLTVGASMGAYMTGQIATFKEIPVLAQIFYGFSGEIWKAQYTLKTSVRKRMCEKFGFTGSQPSFGVSNPPSSVEQKYIKANLDKWAGYDVLVAGMANKNILDTFNVWPSSSTKTSDDEAVIYEDAIVIGRPSCKFFACADDTTAPIRWSQYMAEMIRNGGGYAELRIYETGGHNEWNVGENISMQTKLGGERTVNGSVYEGILFLEKFDV